ncbi:MAG: nucleotidyl transferase AbiEii/AbiGii toxin family protein [Deltaproteobacteria bacterium]|nr:nucleotidyl transferase AbiEii/AbiGii toxin family protein [Deltaproteobacteria bacterium]
MTDFISLFAALNKGAVRYLVTGGIAVNLYGIERATADIDLFVGLDEKNLKKFISVAKELGLKPKVPVALDDFADKDKRDAWEREKNMMVFSLFDPKTPFFLLDVFIKEPLDFEKAYEARKVMKAGNVNIPVISLPDLIDMKKAADRPQDVADVFYLSKILKDWKDEK